MKNNKYRLFRTAAAAVLAVSAAVPAAAADMKKAEMPATAAQTVQAALESPAKQVNFSNMLLADKLPVVEGQPEAETISIDLRGAVATAIENNRDIRISEYSLTEAEAAVSEAAAAKIQAWATLSQGAGGGAPV